MDGETVESPQYNNQQNLMPSDAASQGSHSSVENRHHKKKKYL